MDYALEKLIEERNRLYTLMEFTDKHIEDCEIKLKAYRRDQEWNEKAIKEIDAAIRKLE